LVELFDVPENDVELIVPVAPVPVIVIVGVTVLAVIAVLTVAFPTAKEVAILIDAGRYAVPKVPATIFVALV